jgi:hypothetical protein
MMRLRTMMHMRAMEMRMRFRRRMRMRLKRRMRMRWTRRMRMRRTRMVMEISGCVVLLLYRLYPQTNMRSG